MLLNRSDIKQKLETYRGPQRHKEGVSGGGGSAKVVSETAGGTKLTKLISYVCCLGFVADRECDTSEIEFGSAPAHNNRGGRWVERGGEAWFEDNDAEQETRAERAQVNKSA